MTPDKSVKLLIGFGNIDVKLKGDNDTNKYPYVIGAHGYCVLGVIDEEKFQSKFGKHTSLESNKIRTNTIGTIKQLCSKSLSEFFSDNELSCSEVRSQTGTISKYLLDKVTDNGELGSFGLKILEIVIEEISVNEPNDTSDYEIVTGGKSNILKIISAVALSLAIVSVALIIVISNSNNKETATTSLPDETTSVAQTETESETQKETETTLDIEYGSVKQVGYLKYRYDYDGWSIYECDLNAVDIYIPDTIDGAKVYRIDNEAFKDHYSLVRIRLPESITIISDSAFEGCSSLEEIEIPSQVKFIGDWAFHGCFKLTDITIPDKVLSIGDGAFDECRNLSSLVIPKSVTRIGTRIVGNCQKLMELIVEDGNPEYFSSGNCIIEKDDLKIIAGCNGSVIPGGGVAKSIDNEVFDFCKNLKEVIIPEGIERIGYFQFAYCSELRSIYISSTVTFIDNELACGSEKLESLVVDENNPVYHSQNNCIIETKSKKMIAGCRTSVIPDDGSVTIIGDRAFIKTKNLTSINVPEGIISIEYSAFSECYELTSIYLPSTIEKFDDDVFRFDDKLTDIYFNGTMEQWNSINKGNNTFYGITIHFSDTIEDSSNA